MKLMNILHLRINGKVLIEAGREEQFECLADKLREFFAERSHEIFQSNQFSANRMVADDGILCLIIFWVL